MKKLLLAAISLSFCLAANAQEATYAQKGDLGVELQFNPFSNNFQTFKMDGLSVRYRLTDKDVVRATLSFGIENSTTRPDKVAPIESDYPSGTAFALATEKYNHELDDYSKNSSSSFGLSLGYERHLFQKGRIDIYAGAQIGIEKTWASFYQEMNIGTLNSKGNAYEDWHTNTTKYSGRNAAGTSFASFEFDFGVFTGIDFYVYKKLYVGAELGLNLATNSRSNYTKETETWNNKNRSYDNRKEEYDVKNNSLDVALKALPALRLGWTF